MSTDWAQGYVTDVLYTESFFRELSPSWINYSAIINGCHPRPVDRPFTYLELGCGMGQSIAVLAAAFPKGEFVGVDFNPGHIDAARRYAEIGGIANVRYLERSFQDLVNEDLPEFDFIVLHGVYTWISVEARKAVQEIIYKRLKPGGLVYNSYNCLPGWSADAPIRKIMMEWAKAGGGDIGAKAIPALKFMKELSDQKLGYFQANPSSGKLIEKFLSRDANYLAHEFLNADWQIFYSSEVADEMAAGKLTFCGSATLNENHIELMLADEPAKKITEQPLMRLRQLIQDYAINQRFRRDIFVRGHPHLNRPAITRHLSNACFTLSKAVADETNAVKVPRGEIKFDAKVYPHIAELLSSGVISLTDMRREISSRVKQNFDVDRTMMLMVASGVALPGAKSFSAGSIPQKISKLDVKSKVNKALLAKSNEAASRCHLISEWTGGGISLNPLDVIILSQLSTTWEPVDAAAKRLSAEFKRRRLRVAAPEPAEKPDGEKDAADKKGGDGQSISSGSQASSSSPEKIAATTEENFNTEAIAKEHLQRFLKDQLPVLHRAGIAMAQQ